MRKFILHTIIYSFALLLFSCAGMSKDENTDTLNAPTETEKTPTLDDDMGLEKKSDSKRIKLTKEQKEAFQLRAIQKFQDFIDYIKIISNQKVDVTLRNHSLDLVLELFINDSILIKDSILTETSEFISIRSFLDHIQSLKKPFYIKIEKIGFSSPITADSLNNYTGTIETMLNINGNKAIKNVTVSLVVEKKKFGTIYKKVTEIRLGNIY
jgi:hypothetical protein